MMEHVDFGAGDFQRVTDVSRETLDRLILYGDLLQKWSHAINLVSPATLPVMWRRHFLDSAQLLPLLPPVDQQRDRCILDMGSGAGFPGMVLAILGAGDVHLVESDQKKVVFLKEVARATGTNITIHATRIEQLSPFPADVITARALAPVKKLYAYARPFLGPQTICLFLKGKDVEKELTEFQKQETIAWHLVPSQSDPQAKVLILQGTPKG